MTRPDRDDFSAPYLPPSPLPTQDEANREGIEKMIRSYTESLRTTEVPSYWDKGDDSDAVALAGYHMYCARQLDTYRKKLRDLDGA